LAPHPTDDRFPALLNAPPTVPHVQDDLGSWHKPFIYRWRLVSRLEQRYEEDRSRGYPLSWFSRGHLVDSSDAQQAPLLIIGTDSYGRDLFSRLLFAARISLGLAIMAALGATIGGVIVGCLAGYAGGLVDDLLMRATDVVMVLPAIYVALALRAVLPLVLSAETIFVLLAAIFAIVGAPFIARGVRGIIQSEKHREHALAARALGCSNVRLVTRHLLPATWGFTAVQLTMLVPGFIVAEATLSYVGLGFPDPVASWGTMLHDASNVRSFVDFPWQLSPAVSIFVIVVGLNLAFQRSTPLGVWQSEARRQ
jgi:peptide/nickel transport system permease protein